jgi:hypothetical protein
MRRRAPFTVASLLLAVVLVIYWASHTAMTSKISQSTTPSPASPAAGATTVFSSNSGSVVTPTAVATKKDNAQVVKDVFSAPISFFGIVEDQDGLPIDAAKVEFGAVDKFWESGSNYQTVSKVDGTFAITGIKGAGLTVGVSKEGYEGIKGRSYQSFGYGMPPDSNRKAPPRKDAPAVFVLRKKGNADILFVVRRDVRLPKDGTPIEISLRTGKPVGTGHGDLKIECWTSDQLKDEMGHYDWRARVSVPDGGIVRRIDTENDFTAPETGYASTIEIATTRASIDWKRDHEAHYWVRLRDGTYARMRLRLTTAGDHFATISSYLNPSGSRNLEFDEDKVMK